MALVVKDRVKETTATTGTGTLTLAGAVAGFQAFSAVLSNADTTYYAIFESSTGAFEVGLGTYASPANTLARTTVLESSNAGSAINLTAGDADVFVTQPAEKAVYLDANGYIFTSDGRNLTNLNATNLTSGTVNDARLPATISSDITGNAATATAWATGRTLSLTGDVTGTSAAFDGSGNITLSTTIAANSVALGTDTTGNYVATGAVSGSGLSGSASAEGATFTVTSNATNVNTPSTIVFRDGSGNFSAGTITAALTGNAATATKWATGRTISLTGDVTGTSGAFDGSGNLSFATTIAANSVALGTDTTGNYVATGATSGNGLSGSVSSEGGTFTVTSNATNANTASTIVFRDASGNFSAGTITANLTGTASSATNADTVDSLHASQFLRSDADDAFTGNLTTGADNYITFGPNTSWSSYLRVGGNGRTVSGASSASVVTTNGNLHLDSGSDKATYLNFYAGTAGTFFGSGNEHIVAVMGSDGDLWKGSADNTGSQYWHAGNDGSGSGLDADTVDGLQASQFLRSDAADSTASTISFTGDIEVGDQIFHHGDTDTYMQFHAADEWRVVTGGAERFEINNSDVTVQSALKEKYVALSGTTPSIDVDAGGGFSLTTSGNTTFTFTAFTSALSCGFVLQLTAGGTHTITWPVSVDWAGGTAPDAPASGETDIYVFWSRDGGTTWYGVLSVDAAA
jgi:hypothetical protein